MVSPVTAGSVYTPRTKLFVPSSSIPNLFLFRPPIPKAFEDSLSILARAKCLLLFGFGTGEEGRHDCLRWSVLSLQEAYIPPGPNCLSLRPLSQTCFCFVPRFQKRSRIL